MSAVAELRLASPAKSGDKGLRRALRTPMGVRACLALAVLSAYVLLTALGGLQGGLGGLGSRCTPGRSQGADQQRIPRILHQGKQRQARGEDSTSAVPPPPPARPTFKRRHGSHAGSCRSF